jgi:hypothetical protein
MRTHTFSYDQGNPPPGTIAIAASLFAERTSGGVSLQELALDVERLAASSAELALKLHDIMAATLGSALQEGLKIRFDQRLAASSLQFYDLRLIPAIRGNQPSGVSDIHFRSDLSGIQPEALETLIGRDGTLADFFPDLEAA